MQSAKVSILVGGTEKSAVHYLPSVELSGKNRNAIRHAAAQMAGNVDSGKCALQKGSNPLIQFLTDDDGNRLQ